MKAIYPVLAATVLLASCAQDPAPANTQAKVEAKAPKPKAEAPPKPYPLETCLVSGDDLDEMDERVSTVHEGQTFEFCCKPCLVKFKKDPDNYVAKLAAATKH
jgi:YHS domain-containing protein